MKNTLTNKKQKKVKAFFKRQIVLWCHLIGVALVLLHLTYIAMHMIS